MVGVRDEVPYRFGAAFPVAEGIVDVFGGHGPHTKALVSSMLDQRLGRGQKTFGPKDEIVRAEVIALELDPSNGTNF
jgi:hypothetical protein